MRNATCKSDYKEKIEYEVAKKYLKEFPEIEEKFGVCFANTADGVK